MNYLEHNYSAFPILSLIITGIAVYFLLRLIRFSIPYIAKNRKIRDWANQYFSLIELFVWIVFSLWFLPYLMHRNLYAGYSLAFIIFAIFVWIALYGLRNLIAGFIFRSNHGLKIGEHIQIGDYKGSIVKLAYRNIILDTSNGDLVSLSYSQIINQPITKISSTDLRHSHSFILETAKSDNVQKLTNDIYSSISAHSRSSLTESPKVELQHELGDKMQFSIKIFAIENKYLSVIEEYLRTKFETKP